MQGVNDLQCPHVRPAGHRLHGPRDSQSTPAAHRPDIGQCSPHSAESPSVQVCLILLHHLPQLFRIELRGERGRAHQVTEHHGELPALGFRVASEGTARLEERPPDAASSSFWSCLCVLTSLGGRALPSCLQVACHIPSRTWRWAASLATTRAEPHEWSPTFFTELGSLSILTATARTAHAASLLLRALQEQGKHWVWHAF